MLRTIFIASMLFALWLLLSGVYKPLTLYLGLFSSLAVTLILNRMIRLSPAQPLQFSLHPIAVLFYIAWLMVEITKANWQVIKLILAPQLKLQQNLFKIPYSQKTDLGQTMFANSITLTPGTVSVEIEPDHLLVHVLYYSDKSHAELADMDRHVTKVERLRHD